MSDKFVKVMGDGKLMVINTDRIIAIVKENDKDYFIHMDPFYAGLTNKVQLVKISLDDAERIANCLCMGAY